MFLATGNKRSGGSKIKERKKKGRGGKPVSGSVYLDCIKDLKSSQKCLVIAAHFCAP